MRKKNPLLEKLERQYQLTTNRKIEFTIQLCGDIAMIAANDSLGMGPGRAEKFKEAYENLVNEVGAIMLTESKSNKAGEIDYTKEQIDSRLRAICGDNFQPWEVRYKT